jgi:thiosulfate/3-mercaptopyruvate sulfurtransferase
LYSTLISTAELAAHLDDPRWVIFDCRHDLADVEAGARGYAEAHLPGAHFAHMDKNLSGAKTGRNGRHPLPAREAFVAWLREQGVSETSQVVTCDAQGGIFAARMWWMLRWIGHEAVCVLDGGLGAWKAEGRPLTQAPPAPRKGDISERAGINSVGADYVEARLGSKDWRLIDARSPDRYRGENETLDPVGGHIPGAVNRFYKDNLDTSGRFKSAAQLREEFTPVLGGIAAHDTIQQCGSGVTATHNLLAMEVAGLKGSRLYPGSWSEWVSDPGRPVAKG